MMRKKNSFCAPGNVNTHNIIAISSYVRVLICMALVLYLIIDQLYTYSAVAIMEQQITDSGNACVY